MKQSTSSWRLLILAALLPILVLVAIDVSFDTADTISEFSATIRYQFWTSNTTDNVG